MRNLLRSASLAGAFALATLAAAETVLVQAGRLLDRPGSAPRGNATLVITDGKVVAIKDGFLDAVAAGTPGARVIDLRQRFVLPGLIDSHVHLDSDLAGVAGQLEDV